MQEFYLKTEIKIDSPKEKVYYQIKAKK